MDISYSLFSYSRPPTVAILVFIMYNVVICFAHLILKLKSVYLYLRSVKMVKLVQQRHFIICTFVNNMYNFKHYRIGY